MTELWLNSTKVDIDDKTVIGFEIQTYDIKDPGRPKTIISNNFTIPRTSTNLKVVGFPDNSQTDETSIYSKISVRYLIDNEIFIENARARVEQVSDRIEIFIYRKDDFWDLLKQAKVKDIAQELLEYLCTQYDLPTVDNKYTGDIGGFVGLINSTTRGLFLPYYFSNLANFKNEGDIEYFERPDVITLADGDKQGGHICVYALDIIKFIEQKYSVNFCVDETFDGNLFTDNYASKIFTPFQNITVYNYYGWYFGIKSATDFYSPMDDIDPKADKSLYDYLIGYFKHFNALIDYVFEDGNYKYKCYRFDDILTKGDIKNWSGITKDKMTFKPIISGFGQKSYIKYGSVFDGGSEFLNSKTILVANENIDSEADIMTIDGHISGFAKSLNSKLIPVLSDESAFNNFEYLIDSGKTESVDIYHNSNVASGVTLIVPGYYDISSEYQVFAAMVNKPKIYEVEKWLTLTDIRNLKFFSQYFIEELGGSFFLNKITGFNPASRNTPTKLELIKISNAVPPIEIDGNYWIDGKTNKFTDGKGNYFIW